jgi:hypothetical protein
MTFISHWLTSPWHFQRDTVVTLIKGLKLAGMVVVGIVMLHSKADTLPAEGWRELVMQVPDIELKPGVPAYFPVEIKTIDLDNKVNGVGPPIDNGLFAKSTVPGLSIRCGYCGGAPPQKVFPPYEWAPIGGASGVGQSEPWFGTPGSPRKFAAIFDGSAPNGTVGNILIAVNQAGEGEFAPRVIGSINVFVFLSPKPGWFRVTGTSATVSGNRLILDHPYLNGNFNTKLFVTHVYSAPGHSPMYWNHPVSVAYDTSLERWTIANDDAEIMPQGIVFNVRIDPSGQVVRSANWKYHLGLPPTCVPPFEHVRAVAIDHPSANLNPYATIIVTPRSPHERPIGLSYVAPTWYIVNAGFSPPDRPPLPLCGVYNVQVMGFSEYWSGVPQSIGDDLDPFASNAAGVTIEENGPPSDQRNLPFWWQLGNPDEPIIVTQNLTPSQPPQQFPTVRDPVFVGLSYSGGSYPRWQIVNEDGTAVPKYASFNTWGQPQLTPLPYR